MDDNIRLTYWVKDVKKNCPQWLCGNSYTWAHDEQLHTAGTNEPKSIQQATQGALCKWSQCLHDCIYITLILLLGDLSTLCVVDHL